MKTRLVRVLLVLGAWVAVSHAVQAGVIVLANRLPDEVVFTLTAEGGAAHEHKVPPRELIAVPTARGLQVAFAAKGGRRTLQLEVDMAYVFKPSADGPGLTGIGPRPRGERPESPERDGPKAAEGRPARAGTGAALTIPVKILVDQAEPQTQEGWEPRLRKRVAAASDVLERQCRVKLDVVAVDSWESDNRLTDFSDLLRDFEGKVKVQKARIAIGFINRPLPNPVGQRVGAIQQPLRSHILIREGYPRTEAERAEVVVHEVGHFLGAPHSPEPESVMRARVGDGRVRKEDFPISFDPLNALVVNLVADDMRGREPKTLADLSRPTRERLAQLYAEIAPTIPEDPTPPKYISLLGLKPKTPEPAKP
jgi:hypothetical protein